MEYLPNGNVLILATKRKTLSDCIAAGRNPAIINSGELWPEFLVELQPVGLDSGIIVWEWHVWDHLVQNYDSTQSNYQFSTNKPELFDLNYQNNNANANWMHVNSVNYNPVLDQIVLSSKVWSELWVIDHSTTTAEAAGHSGGNSGKGGDILYRWGNPQTYGGAGPQQLDNPHDIHWIKNGPDAGKIMIFNNGRDRGWSSVDIIDPPQDSLGNYTFASNYYEPTSTYWSYTDPTPTNFFSPRLSGAQLLPNGNVLICAGVDGYLFEIDSSENKVWEYINPVSHAGPLAQGQYSSVVNNSVFRAYRYDASYAALAGKLLTPTVP